MSETSENPKAKLEAAKRRAEQLREMQEEAAREIAEAEALEAAEINKKEMAQSQRAKEALRRSAEKQRLVKEKREALSTARETALAARAAASAGTANSDQASSDVTVALVDDEYDVDDVENDDLFDEPRDAKQKSQRKRLGLRCFNCNRLEGHYLSYYRRAWYSYLVGMTFGIAIIFGPYKCQCCGSQRLMISNLLHPKYYAALSKTRGRSRSKRKSSRR